METYLHFLRCIILINPLSVQSQSYCLGAMLLNEAPNPSPNSHRQSQLFEITLSQAKELLVANILLLKLYLNY